MGIVKRQADSAVNMQAMKSEQRNKTRFVLKPLLLAALIVPAMLPAALLAEEDANISKSALVIDPLGANPSTAAPGDTISYTIDITNNSGTGEFLHGIDVVDSLPAGTENFATGSISGASDVRIFRDNIENGDGFNADGAASGNDGNTNFTGDWQETSGSNGTQENDGEAGGDIQILGNSGRTVIRIRDDQNPANDRGEGVYRIANLNSCSSAILSFEISGTSLDSGGGTTGGDGIYLDESTNGTSWNQLVRFDPDGTTTAGSLTDGNRDIVNGTYQAHAVSLGVSSTTSYIRFTTDDDVNNNEGAYLDNIQITAICGSASRTMSAQPNLLTSSVFDGINTGKSSPSTPLSLNYSVTVAEGRTTDITNTAQVLYTDLVGNATTIGGNEQTLSDTSGTNTVTLTLRDDYGDAPLAEGYTTRLVDGGPRHLVTAGIHLGNTAPDLDSGGFVEGTDNNGNATDDDAGGDEGLSQLLNATEHPSATFPPLSATTSSYSLTLDYTSTAGTSAIYGWIDFDHNGLFEESERVTATGLTGTGNQTLTWNNFPEITGGYTYARFRIATSDLDEDDDANDAEDDASIGFAENGEVEDYIIYISGPDYGDAPASYGDASHLVPETPTLYIGATAPDAEIASIYDSSAAGDDNDTTDDEDNLVISGLDMLDEGGTYQLDVPVAGQSGATLFGWIDFNGDGDFDTSEGTSVAATSTETVSLVWTVPTGANNLVAGNTFLRLRLTTDASINVTTPTGVASDGEVEDQALTIGEFQDYGDVQGYGDPAHQIRGVQTLYLGPIGDQPDSEGTTQASGTGADEDDSDGNDDENSVSTFPGLTAADDGSTYSLNVTYNNTNGNSGAVIYGWIDFNVDGDFDDAGEAAMVAATNSSADATAQLSWTVPSGANLQSGASYVRLRITSDGNVSTSTPSTVTAADGEVEDYSLTIFDEPIDYGDAPILAAGDYDDTNFSGASDAFDNRASHLIVAGIRLGSNDPDIDIGTFGDGVDDNQDASDDDSFNDPNGGIDDEDGISTIGALSVLDSSYSLTLSVNNSHAAKQANVYAWIDFDNNQSFDENERAVVTGGISSGGKIPVSSGGNVTLSWPGIPADIEATTTYLRVRITTDALDQLANGNNTDDASLGAASDGEVEDYQLVISGADYGDAPASYGDASHDYLPSQDFYLGTTSPDGESTTQYSADADGDDMDGGGDDEDAIASFPLLRTSDSGTYSLSVDFVNTGADADIRGWIDFDGDGLFEAGEASSLLTVTSATSSPQNLDFNLPGTINAGNAYARIRITRDSLGTGDATGSMSDGEVEDFSLRIEGVDYGDAPPAYPTASNYSSDEYYLGAVPGDPETATNNSAHPTNPADDLGTGDDQEGVDDEDGTSIPALVQNLTSTIEVNVNGAGGYLSAYFDWNDDGDFNDANEDVAVNVQDGGAGDGDSVTGTITLAVQVPGTAATSPSFARLRWSETIGGGQSGDQAAAGEVEDYGFQVLSGLSCVAMPVTVNQNAVLGNGFTTAPDADGGSYTIKDGEYLITSDQTNQRGQIWGDDRISLHQDFDYQVYVYLGDKDASGADGMAFLLQTEGTSAVGAEGGGLGYGIGTGGEQEQINPSLAVEFDTWQNGESGTGYNFSDPADDHTAVTINGDPTHGAGNDIQAPVSIGGGDIEDGLYHLARVIWDAENQIIRYYFDSQEIVTASIDLVDYFGTDLVYWGYTGSTGGSRNLQTACAQTTFSTASQDYDDAPSSYGDAWHNLGSGGLRLGDTSDSDPVSADNDGDIDDGFDLDSLIVGTTEYSIDSSRITALNSTGSVATIYAWIDFDANGTFDDDEFASTTINPGASSPVTDLSWSGVPSLTPGTVYSRFRITTNSLTDTDGSGLDSRATGTASNGEVEDYAIDIFGGDFGDAPSTYGDASHVVSGSPDLYLGTVQPDTDAGTQDGGDAGVGADGDDSGGTDDEEAIASFASLSSQSSGTYSVTLAYTNSGANAELSGWIDFDGNGLFETDEFATATVGASGSASLDFDLDALGNGVVAGTTYARFRISRDTGVLSGDAATSSATGVATDGEVEDYVVEITGVDFGDAPASYGTPAHEILANPTLYLGAQGDQPDGEAAAQPTVGANGDNANGTDDENAISAFAALTEVDDGAGYSLDVTYNNATADAAAVLYGWIDFNGDGDFDDANEAASAAATSGVSDSTATLNWTLPSGPDLVAGTTYARIRLTTDASVTTSTASTLLATDGEIEDYVLEIGQEDFGDAPSSYGDASHVVYQATGVYLGDTAPDSEDGSQDGGDAGVGADGDDATNTDDESITITGLDSLDEGQPFSLDLPVSGASGAVLYGWIDFDGSGDFEVSEMASVAAISSGTVTLNWTVPSGANFSVGATYARFRITTDTDFIAAPAATGRASNGEVEDVALTITQASDYGDAPISYGDPGHGVSGTPLVYMGPAAGASPDAEEGTQYSVDADADDTTETDDENGVTPVALNAGSGSYSLSVTVNNNSGVDANLYGWIDFDGNGTFDDDELADSVELVSDGTDDGTVDLDWSSFPSDIQVADTYLRLRFTTDSLTDSGGSTDSRATDAATDGEVEDYQLSINGLDYGDAPETGTNLNTLSASGGPSHGIDASLYLGDVVPDPDSDGYREGIDSTGNAGDDDDNGDEGVAQLLSSLTGFPALAVTDTSYSLTVDVYNNTGSPANLYAWIDFDGNGFFDEDEIASVAGGTVGSSGTSQSVTLNWTGLNSSVDINQGVSYARFRLTTDTLTFFNNGGAAERADGAASDGEVEDYQFGIAQPDYGDAPSVYGDASHIISMPSDLYLGSVEPDGDTSTQDGGDAGLGADGDDGDGSDDEDSVASFPAINVLSTGTYSLDVDFVNTGADAELSAWIDFDRDGVFENDEFATTTVTSATSSPVTLDFDLDSLSGGLSNGLAYARVRITRDASILTGTAASSSSIGQAADGEVEDYEFSISGFDFGDAPASYGDASHQFGGSPGVYLGADGDQPDAEAGTQYSSSADGDDTNGSDDENSVGSVGAVQVSSGSHSISAIVNNSSGADAYLYAWIDLNRDGVFDETDGELADSAPITIANGAVDSSQDLTWSSFPGDIDAGASFVRIRITTELLTDNSGSADSRSYDAAPDGEVEDYLIDIVGTDFGDAPEAGTSYHSLLANNGPRHTTSADIYLGNQGPDLDSDGFGDGTDNNGNATDDDSGGDEGVVQLLSSGSSFPALNAESTSYQITVDLFNNTGSTGQLLAWIDFDQSGSFDEDEVGTVSTTIASSGSLQSKTISWSGLGSTVDIQSGQTYARFRLTTDTLTFVGDAGPDERADGAATDGEVEDYAIGIGNRDYGDAPDSGVGQGPGNYRSLLEDDGPRHTIVSGIRLGSTNPDIDINAFGDGTDSTGNAGDDELSGGDEGIAQLLLSGNSDFPELLSTTDSYSLDVRMANTSGGPVRIYAWIDFDQSGTFDEDEAAVASGLIGNVANRTLIWSSIPEDVTGGLTPTYIRFRITSDPLASDGMGGEDERSYGSASTGEVEDYPISIIPVDFGDAPDSYGTLDTSEGASHQVVSGIYLGDTAPDGEVDGFVDGVDDNLFALDDDSNGDEGIDQLLNGAVSSFPALNVGDATYGALTLDIATTANATVWGWIDFDQDGIFEESERAEAAVTSSDSTATLSWSGLPTMTPGNSYARFRIATNGSLADIDDADDGVVDDASINFASDGEIEDYLVTISGSGTISGRVFEDPNYGGGNGRDYATANSSYAAADVGVEATVELWASNGSSCTGGAPLQTTNANEVDGSYSFSGVALPDDYCVRVVNTSVLTNRTTSGGGLAIQTFRVESTDGFGTLDAIVNEVGGRSPGDVDSAANTFDDSYGDGIAAQSWSLISVGSSGISGIDFGYSFNTVVNTNSAGQGSLRQFILNANAMNDAAGDGLAQSGQTAGIDVSIFAIPASDPNYNLLAQGEYYIGLDVSDGAFASLTSPVELNATTQTGISCPVPRIHIDGSALTGADGFDISVAADGSLVRGFVINGFDGYGIDLSADNSTLDCNYIGTDIGGNASGNGGNDRGIRITGDNNLVGGDRSTSGNVISGNNNGGLQIIGSGNQIYGNYIGLGSNGASQVANGGNGVSISGSDNLVGDSATASLRNRIAYNGDNGVRISSGTGNLVTANSIFNNGGLGLNLSGGTETGGVTANDSGDGDSGANNLLNYLTWNSVVPSGNNLEYDLDVDVPTGSYRIEFYANAVCNADQTGVAQAETHGEGQQLLGSISFTSSGSEINIDSDLDPGDNFPELSGVVPGLVGGEITALVIDDNNGHTSEFSACETAITSQVISGTIFDDVNYGGGSGRNYSTANADFVGEVGTQATVELWSSDGVLCTGGAPIQTVTSSASDGSYSFNVVATGATHCVRVVNDSVRSKRSGWSSSLIPVQTYRAEFPDDVAGSVTEVIDEVGGESPQDVDVAAGVYDRNAGDGSISQSVSFVDLPDDGTTAVTGIDFGFNFDTIVNTNSDGQGSFRQFILNANALGDENNLAQSGERLASSSLSTETLPTQTETSIFMISNASAGVDGINPTRQNLLVGAQYADISLDTSITVTDEDTNIDGTTLSVNINNPNGGSIGSNEAVGATGSDNLPGVYRPEVQVSGSQINLAASDVEVRGIAFLPTSTALNITASSDVLIENNVFGAGAITYADTGSGGSSDLVVVNGTSTGTRSIHNNLFGYGDNSGLSLTNTNGWSITENEFQGFGDAGLSIGSNTNDLIIEVNLFENNGVGLHLGNTGSDSASLIQDNSILSNTGVGLLIASGANGENENSIVQNLVSLNGDDGIQLNAGSDNTLSQNSIFNNQGLGINLTGSANSGAVVPVITSALATDGVNIDISGTYAGLAGDTLEFYSSAVCNGDTAGMAQATTEGEGQTFHSTTDADGGSGFSVQIPIADVAGSVITVMATDTSGNSSEFSVCSTALISDWGDAPESYGTTASANGPNHVRNDSLLLGSTVDAEEDGFVDGVDDNLNTASDDDLSGDDEDGVASFPPLTTAASSYSVDVSLENSTGANAYLLGWIDFDLNGTFDSNEAAMATVNNGATSATLNWNSVPIDIAVGNSFVRLRYSSYSGAGESVPASASAASPLGALLSGEVEDYLLPIAQGYDYGDAPASFDSPTPA